MKQVSDQPTSIKQKKSGLHDYLQNLLDDLIQQLIYIRFQQLSCVRQKKVHLDGNYCFVKVLMHQKKQHHSKEGGEESCQFHSLYEHCSNSASKPVRKQNEQILKMKFSITSNRLTKRVKIVPQDVQLQSCFVLSRYFHQC